MADMTRRAIAKQDVVTLAEVKALAAVDPCITLVMPIPNPARLASRRNSALRSLRKQLVERHTDRETAGGLLAPIEQLTKPPLLHETGGRGGDR